MRHFPFLTADEQQRLFLRPPQPFLPGDDPTLIGTGLGATLYCPGTRSTLADDIVRRTAHGVITFVVCLEDAVRDEHVADAERNTALQVGALSEESTEIGMVFVRVRRPDQIPHLVAALGSRHQALTGFVVPKFDEVGGQDYLEALLDAETAIGRRLLLMPVLETPEIGHPQTRVAALAGIRAVLDKYRDHVPAVRVGATDLSSGYGLRRSREFTVWDLRVVADTIAAIVGVLGGGDDGYVIAGAAWEHFPASERLFKPQLRESPFAAQDERPLRARLLAADLDGLIREVALDRANGLVGKTVIHPTQVPVVHALSVVAAEEWADASDILATGAGGGAAASAFGNKMNESKPHMAWARRTALRAQLFGVAREDVSFVDLLGAGLHS